MATKKRIHVHPGEILKEEFLIPLDISPNRLATSLGVPVSQIRALLKGSRRITAEIALLLGKAFNTTPEFWINLQTDHDLKIAKGAVTADRIQRAERLGKGLQLQGTFGRKLLKLKGSIDPSIDLEY
jgi:antitoxin HigA-1